MESEVKEFNKFITPRVAQLSQRSNQFNLRTIRYSDSDIENIINDKKFKTFYFTLKDKFGDNGLISAIILEKNDQHTLFISSWFMSCRVLKRSMENFILNTVVQFAIENGFKRIVGEYIPTSKNQMVKDLYMKMGFNNGLSENIYTLDPLSYTLRESFITKII